MDIGHAGLLSPMLKPEFQREQSALTHVQIFHHTLESLPMPRDTPAALTAMQKVQLASARQRLKIDSAKARAVEEVERDADVKLNRFGRPIAAYEDMPELEESDKTLLRL